MFHLEDEAHKLPHTTDDWQTADTISKKTKEEYASVMNHMRTRNRFSIMRSILVALRGQRCKPTKSTKPLAVTSFDLIPWHMKPTKKISRSRG